MSSLFTSLSPPQKQEKISLKEIEPNVSSSKRLTCQTTQKNSAVNNISGFLSSPLPFGSRVLPVSPGAGVAQQARAAGGSLPALRHSGDVEKPKKPGLQVG